VDDIDGNDIGWTLGAIIVEANMLPYLVQVSRCVFMIAKHHTLLAVRVMWRSL
jgi:hypothetical protein